MIRRFVLPLLGSGLLLAGTATGVLAKCEGPNPPEFCQQVVAYIDDTTTGSLQAGTSAAVYVWIRKGEQPYAVKSVLLSFSSYADGQLVRAEAIRTGQAGQWRADVKMPTDGGWKLTAYVVDLDGVTTALAVDATLVVRPKAPPVTTPTTPTPPVTPTPTLPALPIALLVAGIAAAGMAGVALRDRTRRPAGGQLAGNRRGAISTVEASSTTKG
jgi:hypothetical protein